jgi:hypothetical protein
MDGRDIVLTHKAAIAFDIGAENRCQLALHRVVLRIALTGHAIAAFQRPNRVERL